MIFESNIADGKLKKFEEAVLSDAQEHSDEIISEYQARRQSALEKADMEILENIKNQMRAEIIKIRNSTGQRILAAELDWKVRLIERREQITDEILEAVKKRILNFVSGAKYIDYLVSAAESVKDSCCNPVILMRGADMQYADRLKEIFPDAEFKPDDNIELGGFIICDYNKGIKIIMTLDEKFRNQVEYFESISGLDVGE